VSARAEALSYSAVKLF